MRSIVPAIITIVTLAVTLATYIVPVPALTGIRPYLVQVAIIVAAFAMILGGLNLIAVHGSRVFRQRPGWFYSLVLLLVLVVVVAFGLFQGLAALARGQNLVRDVLAGGTMMWIYQYVLLPIQASLAALLPFFLAYAAYRTIRVRRTSRALLGAVTFMLTAIFVLLGQVPLFGQIQLFGQSTVGQWLQSLSEWIVRVPAMAGMRGIVLGVALGITATALRVLIGADRPSSD